MNLTIVIFNMNFLQELLLTHASTFYLHLSACVYCHVELRIVNKTVIYVNV